MTEAPWKACHREDCVIVRDSFTTGTLMAWEQTYDKHGRPTSVDPNLYEAVVCCRQCKARWLEQKQAGKVAYITLTPAAPEPRTYSTQTPMTKWTQEVLASLADTLTVNGLTPAGKTHFHHANQVVMIFHPDGRLEFPLLDTYPDSVKSAAEVLCEHVSAAHGRLTADNIRLRLALRQAEQWFAEYAEIHRAKGADDKAARNQERADFCARQVGGDNV